jgi:hypothetical protein
MKSTESTKKESSCHPEAKLKDIKVKIILEILRLSASV